MDTSELTEAKRNLRSKRIELRYYLSIAAFILVAFILLALFILTSLKNTAEEIKKDNEHTRQLICGIVGSIPDFPKNDDCETIKKNEINPNKGDQKSSIVVLPPITTDSLAVSSPAPSEPIAVTPQPIKQTVKTTETRLNPVTNLPEWRYIGDFSWRVCNEVCP